MKKKHVNKVLLVLVLCFLVYVILLVFDIVK